MFQGEDRVVMQAILDVFLPFLRPQVVCWCKGSCTFWKMCHFHQHNFCYLDGAFSEYFTIKWCSEKNVGFFEANDEFQSELYFEALNVKHFVF